MSDEVLQGPVKPAGPGSTKCCGDPTNKDGNAHPWELIDDSYGDLYRCPVCGAEDTD